VKICVFEKRRKRYVKCKRDGSIRKKGCPCANFKQSFIARLFDENERDLKRKNRVRFR
jgi:hypothetical protein